MTSAGRRVFVVEDEALVLINLEDILEQLGWNVAAQAMRLSEAEQLATSVEAIDVAILDVNLGGARVFPVAQILRERGVPILFATGYGRDGLPPEWDDHAVIVKPYSQTEVEQALDRLLGASV
ncbi:CheY-like chemotaxis protein [Devosia subaequoris]|uniref:CheY-like chemotaxis protein n=1 Tax=Devosia subaequoris TaxID=395930 RepID=A0A7W6IL70_9HYPH|nr:response regulator [Devosia subaequoris]MBB4051648.1 CheY-like chemotaxis protein [Devosia subaequoris]MCP1209235.1 response regulator [Devosia subaequoris]